MINFFAKFLVIVYTVLSIAAMTWAAAVFLQFKDYGWTEPYKEVLDYTKEGNEKTSVRHASIYDKSLAALNEAAKTRDLAYARVKPAVDKLKATEPFLADNHLYYTKVLKELREATGPIEVKRLEDAGTALEGGNQLGKPLTKIAVNGVTKSFSRLPCGPEKSSWAPSIRSPRRRPRANSTRSKKRSAKLSRRPRHSPAS